MHRRNWLSAGSRIASASTGWSRSVLAIWSFATFLTGFADGLTSSITLRLVLGIGEGVAFPSASKIIARHVAGERRGLANAVPAAALAWGASAWDFPRAASFSVITDGAQSSSCLER